MSFNSLVGHFPIKLVFPDSGLIQQWYLVTERSMIDQHRRRTINEEDATKGLSLVDIQTSFYILGIGLTLCTVVFLWELISHKCRGSGRK